MPLFTRYRALLAPAPRPQPRVSAAAAACCSVHRRQPILARGGATLVCLLQVRPDEGFYHACPRTHCVSRPGEAMVTSAMAQLSAARSALPFRSCMGAGGCGVPVLPCSHHPLLALLLPAHVSSGRWSALSSARTGRERRQHRQRARQGPYPALSCSWRAYRYTCHAIPEAEA